MNVTVKRWVLRAPTALLILSLASFLQAQGANQQTKAAGQPSASEQKVTVAGAILKHDADTLTVRDGNGSDVVVAMTGGTEIKEKKSNPFRRGRTYTAAQLLRGLSISVTGRKNSAGQLVAEEIKVNDTDLRYANSIETRVDPIETRLGEVETKLVQSEQNAQRLSGQVEEVASIAKAARGAAKAAQDTGDAAKQSALDAARQGIEAANSTARAANERIASLDDYNVKSTTPILFSVGGTTLAKEAKEQLDVLATSAKNEKGYLIEVTGFASSEGDAELNARLSERRADVVLRYLMENHAIPLRRMVTPFGFGAKNPVADNSTRDGRKQNRRVEVKVLVNKGLVGQTIK